MNATGITLAGAAGALVVLYANLAHWWKGKREAKGLAPLTKGAAGGLVAAVCPGGILGWVTAHTGQAANTGGGGLVHGATGVQASTPISHGTLDGLTVPGAVIVVLIAASVVFAWRGAEKRDRWRILGGAFVMIMFCLTAGGAGALDWVPGALNSAGEQIKSSVESA